MKFKLFTWIEIHRFSSGQRNGSNAGQLIFPVFFMKYKYETSSCLHKKYTLYTFVIESQNSDHSALIKSVFKKIYFVTCTSSSPLCPGFLPQVSCLDILSEFARKIRILRYFAVLAKSLAPKTKFGLLPKRLRINKEGSKEDLYLTSLSWHFEKDICSGCCDISPIVIYWAGNLSLDHQVSYVQLKRYEG